MRNPSLESTICPTAWMIVFVEKSRPTCTCINFACARDSSTARGNAKDDAVTRVRGGESAKREGEEREEGDGRAGVEGEGEEGDGRGYEGRAEGSGDGLVSG